jgi:4-hydroxy-tetrahydrodipicolinate reductase
VHVVVGTTGFDPAPLREAGSGDGRPRANVFIAPNFAIDAVLMMRFAAEAARHMKKADIIELHHDGKLDAPSGTAARTAELTAAASAHAPPPIHSVRLPGLVAHQEVILGDVGQTLTIRHDTISRGKRGDGGRRRLHRAPPPRSARFAVRASPRGQSSANLLWRNTDARCSR